MENWRPTLTTFLFCGDALASRMRRFTLAESGLLFAGFLDVYIASISLPSLAVIIVLNDDLCGFQIGHVVGERVPGQFRRIVHDFLEE